MFNMRYINANIF